MTTTLHIYVSGMVQGVCFRAATRDEANRLRLAGWVRNLPDGRVEIMAEGAPDDLAALLAWCRHGPRFADVTGVVETWGHPESCGDTFRIVF